MAKLILLALLLGTAARGQVMQQFNMGLRVPAAACLSFYPQDALVMMTGQSVGATVTNANMQAGMDPSTIPWSVGAGFTFAASQVGSGLPAAVPIVGGGTHTCGFATQALALNAANTFTTASFALFSGATKVVLSGFAKLPPNEGTSAELYDMTVAGGANSGSSTETGVFQAQSGSGFTCGAYGVEIEASSSAHPATHSSCNTATSTYAGAMVYYTMYVNWAATGTTPCSGPCVALNLYDPSSFTQIGTTITQPLQGTDSIGTIYYGNNEFGTFAGTLYQQNIMVELTNINWPNVPH